MAYLAVAFAFVLGTLVGVFFTLYLAGKLMGQTVASSIDKLKRDGELPAWWPRHGPNMVHDGKGGVKLQ